MKGHVLSVGGIILCGGQSRRMGESKAWLPFAGKPMLLHVVDLLAQVVHPVVVVAAPRQEVPDLPDDVALVRDAAEGRGPLQGLAAGLQALEGKVDAAYVSSCDVPLLRPAFVRRMIELLGDAAICVPEVGEHHHPLAGVYRVEVRHVVEKLLSEDRLRPFFLLQEVKARVLTEDDLGDVDPEFASLRNVNTPEEYRAALEWKPAGLEDSPSGLE